ncbi:MAG: hypothetical protein WD065_05190 [Planctomycetaceae bacterium]
MNDERPNLITDLEAHAEGRKPLVIRLLQWKVVIPVMILLMLLVAPLLYRSYLLNGIPAIGDPFDVEAFGTVNLPDVENAKIDYEAAMAAMVPLPAIAGVDVAAQLDDALTNGWEHAGPTIRTWLDDNRPAMEQWKLGTEKPDFLYVQPKELSINTLLPLIQELRTFARLAQLETSRLLSEGKPAEAWVWARATYRCSRHLGRYGVAIERLVGMALHAMSIDSMMMKIAEHPTTTESLLQEMLKEIQEQYAKTPPTSTMMKCEYLMFKNTIHDPKMMREISNQFNQPAMKVQYEYSRVLGIEPQMSQMIAQQFFANILEQIDLPMHQRQRRTGHLDLFEHDPGKSYRVDRLTPDEIERHVMKSYVARYLLPALSQADTACLREACRQRAFEFCLAARIFQLRTGAYPSDANELVSAGILADVPADPYSPTGEKLRYRHAGDEVVAWSVGENGIDDGGGTLDAEDYELRYADLGIILGREKDGSVEAKKP